MVDPQGFLQGPRRELPTRRPVGPHQGLARGLREQELSQLQRQAGRCMGLRIPFCHNGLSPREPPCGGGTDLAWRGDWAEAIERLHATNNSLSSPAGCARRRADRLRPRDQPARGDHQAGGGHHDRAGLARAPSPRSRRSACPARRWPSSVRSALAAAQQLTRAGHTVAVYERGEKAGRAAALRDPRVQDGEGRPGPAAGPDGGRGHPVPKRRRRRRRDHRAAAGRPLRRGRPGHRCDGAP